MSDSVVVGWAGLSELSTARVLCGHRASSRSTSTAPRAAAASAGLLLAALVDAARDARLLEARVPGLPLRTPRAVSLCRSCGFREVGTYEKHGRLDGRWIDVVIVERLIAGKPRGRNRAPAPPHAKS